MQPEWKLYLATASAFHQANDFFNAFQILEKQNKSAEMTTKENRFTETRVIVAHWVNLAFSIELGLKALHFSRGRKIKGHKIKDLFKLLPTDQQAEITKHVIAKFPHYTLETFDIMLDKHNDAFNKIRYFHEIGQCVFDVDFCSVFAGKVLETAGAISSRLQVELPAWVRPNPGV